MKIHSHIGLILFVLCFYFSASASSAENHKCATPKAAQDILSCLQVKHPEVLSEDAINEVSAKLSKQGDSWKNPEVSLQSIQGSSLGSKIVESEARLSQTIEIGGQRAARRDKGNALGLSFKADSLGKLEEVTISGVKSLYRLTQIRDESDVVLESVARFKTIKNQYQSRPRLNPEQEVTLGIIQLAVSEYEIKLNHLNTEKKEILGDISASTGLSIEEIEKSLPATRTDWPEPPRQITEFKPSTILKSQSQVDLALSEFEEAKAQVWPEITVSLIAQDRIEGSLQNQMLGAAISLPLPIFQQNQGEKSLKATEFIKAKKVHTKNLIKQESSVKNLIQVYETSVTNLKNTPTVQSIETRHKRVESLFSQGLIAGPIFVESHKQRVEYLESRNEEELQALEALWQLYILNGTFLNQKI